MALFTESSRSKFESTAYTALLLAFFFAVGLAGGVLYRLLPTTNSNEEVAQNTSAPAIAAPPATPVTPVKPIASVTEAAAPPATTAPAKPISTPAKAASAPPKPPPAPVSPPSTVTASAPLPAIAVPTTQPVAALPGSVAPIAGEPPSVAASVATTSDRLVASIPAPNNPATPDLNAARPISAAKPSAAAAKPKTQPEKRVAAAGAPPPPALPPSTGSAAGSVRVQFGAFAIEDNAHQVQWAVEATGLAVEVTHLPTPKGRMLYYVRSQPFPDRAAAVSAATTAQDKAKGFVNPVAIDYIIVSDSATPAQQAQATGH